MPDRVAIDEVDRVLVVCGRDVHDQIGRRELRERVRVRRVHRHRVRADLERLRVRAVGRLTLPAVGLDERRRARRQAQPRRRRAAAKERSDLWVPRKRSRVESN